jgi:hypothetical protein
MIDTGTSHIGFRCTRDAQAPCHHHDLEERQH